MMWTTVFLMGHGEHPAIEKRCIIWFSSSCVRPLGPCVPLLRVSCGRGARCAGCGGDVGNVGTAGLKEEGSKQVSCLIQSVLPAQLQYCEE